MTSSQPPNPLGQDPATAEILTGLARAAIAAALGAAPPAGPLARRRVPQEATGPAGEPGRDPLFLSRPGAAFVTLTLKGRLRGCVGSLLAHRPLGQDIQRNAVAAALEDTRFRPLTAAELDVARIEVSVLSTPQPVVFLDRADLLASLTPGVDGLILEAAGRCGTFLPQVWQELPLPEQFLSHLVTKAGLPPGYWSDSVRLSRYTVTAYEEPERMAPGCGGNPKPHGDAVR
jgi:AmmeMemoRadiSam system protein A